MQKIDGGDQCNCFIRIVSEHQGTQRLQTPGDCVVFQKYGCVHVQMCTICICAEKSLL